ncbi:PIN domain protein [bacterium]|nr:PIN domain protein [FCB group bacterium]MBL7192113.1 PIN domain protein [bacterium]
MDTSVFGGCFDDEFSESSRKLFDEIKAGRFILVVSVTTLRELAYAPPRIWRLLEELPEEFIEVIAYSDEIRTLRDAYINAGVVGSANLFDAEHIASASVANVDLIVSWNFRHIVNFRKIRGYHAVNLVQGYHPISIHSPNEVIE